MYVCVCVYEAIKLPFQVTLLQRIENTENNSD